MPTIKVKWQVTTTYEEEIDLDKYDEYDVTRDDFKVDDYTDGDVDSILEDLENTGSDGTADERMIIGVQLLRDE